MNDLTQFFGPNAGYALELFERFQQNPDSVDPQTRAAFEQWTPDAAAAVPAASDAPVRATPGVTKIVAAARLTRLVRELGHLDAHLDPLALAPPPGDPGLRLETQGLETDDLAALPASVVGGPLAEDAPNALEAVGRLRRAYSGSVGYEDDHIQSPDERNWLREAAESRRFFGLTQKEKRDLLERLSEVEGFERFLHSTFIGAKRFSLEGTDMLVPILDSILRDAAAAKTREVVMGMAHRGRLNVLAHILGKPYAAILSEFTHGQDAAPAESGGGTLGYTGDVKYHLGARRTYKFGRMEENADGMPVTLAPNPSHLEFVNPVAVGRARAAQEGCDARGLPAQDPKAALAILIHGDAAFPGQGIVAETLNLSRLPGYTVGGAIHIIVNNQIGFTTVARDSRSTLYASDLAKGFEIPIVHVNADDVDACIAVARMAHAYREKFGKDFLIDLIGYRRWGHNESDEPAYTQPRMYEKVRSHPTVREIWAKTLETENVVTRDEATQMASAVKAKLTAARKGAAEEVTPPKETANGTGVRKRDSSTGLSAEILTQLNQALLTAPGGFTTDAKLEKLVLAPRRAALEGGRLTWAHAESLAFASILADGTPIRLTGQDAERGTFSQRHAVWHDPTNGETYTPLDAIPQARASFALYNSPLSENACVGFEYGYSIHATGALVLWEGQFGDFVNGAQVIIDQFLVSGNAKWGQTPSLVLLLPHGYEGSGPEHSSARLERFLELAADGNIRVVNPTTSAQYFHLLRRQAALLHSDPRPLIVMTPKAFLKVDRPPYGSPLSDLTTGAFRPVLADAVENPARVTRLILCSGKVYTDLRESPTLAEDDTAAAARVEELYPFPVLELAELAARFPNLREVVWLQEEPRNMGAWGFVAPPLRDLLGPKVNLRYAGRPASGSPAEGSSDRHAHEQARIIADSLRTEHVEPGVKAAVQKEVKRGEESRVD